MEHKKLQSSQDRNKLNTTLDSLLYSFSSALLTTIVIILTCTITEKICYRYSEIAAESLQNVNQVLLVHGVVLSTICGGIFFSYIIFQQKYAKQLQTYTIAILSILLGLVAGLIYYMISHTIISVNIQPQYAPYVRYIPIYYGSALQVIEGSILILCKYDKFHSNLIAQFAVALLYIALNYVLTYVIYSMDIDPAYIAFSGIFAALIVLVISTLFSQRIPKLKYEE